MSDDNTPWYSPDHRPAGNRQRWVRVEVWRLRNGAGKVQACEIRDQSNVGAGWDVLTLKDGEPLTSRRCVDEQDARRVAEACRQDNIRGGWTDSDDGEKDGGR